MNKENRCPNTEIVSPMSFTKEIYQTAHLLKNPKFIFFRCVISLSHDSVCVSNQLSHDSVFPICVINCAHKELSLTPQGYCACHDKDLTGRKVALFGK